MSIVFCFVCFNLMLEDHDDFNRKKKFEGGGSYYKWKGKCYQTNVRNTLKYV